MRRIARRGLVLEQLERRNLLTTLDLQLTMGGDFDDIANDITVDSAGNVYLVGDVAVLSEFPTTPGAFQPQPVGGRDVFVAKFDPDGQLIYSTYLGGFSDDYGTSIAVDALGHAFIGGWTYQSANYPTTAGAFQTDYVRRMEAFVTKLSPDGSELVYSTYLGGNHDDQIHAIDVDQQGNAYVAGTTTSYLDFPLRNPIQAGAPNSHQDAFVAKLNADGTDLVFSTFVRGSHDDSVTDVHVDNDGNSFVSGYTSSVDFPTTPGAFRREIPDDGVFKPSEDAFALKINSNGDALVYSTYVGGSFIDLAHSATLLDDGRLAIAGQTGSEDFPVTANAVQSSFAGGRSDAFVVIVNVDGSALDYGTYLGGSTTGQHDRAEAIINDGDDQLVLAGWTGSIDFPTTGTVTPPPELGSVDGFVARLQLGRSTLASSYRLGTTGVDALNAVALDNDGRVFAAGQSLAAVNLERPGFPTYNDVLLLRLTDSGSGENPWHNHGNALDVSGDGNITPQDALIPINFLNANAGNQLPNEVPAQRHFYDVSNDRLITPLDVLMVINFLNRLSGEGESPRDWAAWDLAFETVDDKLAAAPMLWNWDEFDVPWRI